MIIEKIIEKIFRFDVIKFINEAIKICDYKTYVEIGVRTGTTFRAVKGIKNKIAIDVKRFEEFNHLNDCESFYEMTSDEFFNAIAPSLFENIKIDIAFIDGYHEFFQVTRDFINIEKYISEKGIVFIHDCNPASIKHAGKQYGGKWNGDVWKLAYLLNTKRTDLKFFTLNCDEGVGIVVGFSDTINGFDFLSTDYMNSTKSLNYNFLEAERGKNINLKSPLFWKKIKTML